MSSSRSNEPSIDQAAAYDEELTVPPPEETSEPLAASFLQREARERARKQPLLQRIVRAFQKENEPFREVILNSEPLERRVAVLEDGVLEKFEIEREGEDRIVGAIFKGKIQNLEPGLKAAFVDIGQPKNAFLHYWDILPAANDSSIEYTRDNFTEEQKARQGKTSLKDIPSLYPIGTDIVVQVTKGQIGTKGPRTTTNLSLPGRFLVLMPYNGQCGVSRKIEDPKERTRLKQVLKELTLPPGMGVIIRTAGEGKKIRYFVRDLHILLKQWEDIRETMERSKKPTLLYQEPDLVERTVRDFLTEDVDRVLVDNALDHTRMQEIVSKISSRAKSKIQFFDESIPIFERFNIERQIDLTFQRRVPLPSGGEIVIEETEALVAIDVNTGSHRAKAGANKSGNFILQVNLEAAEEACRQIRLRNIGGLIILDFIDMKQKRDRNALLKKMRTEMDKDKAKCHVLPVSQLGIMQMTRQRHAESNFQGIYTQCPYCSGKGIVKNPRTMSVEIQRRLVSVMRRLRANEANKDKKYNFRILCHPTALERLRLEDEKLLIDIEQFYQVSLSFRADPAFHVENFKIIDVDTNQEMR